MRRTTSPIRGSSPSNKDVGNTIDQSSYFIDFKQPLEIYCLSKSKLHIEKASVLTLAELKNNQLEDDILYLQDPDKYLFCIRLPNLIKGEKPGILKNSYSRLLSPESPQIKPNKLAAFNCRFKEVQQKATTSSRLLGEFLLPNFSKPQHRSTKSLKTMPFNEEDHLPNNSRSIQGPLQTAKSLSNISKVVNLDRPKLLNQKLVLQNIPNKTNLTRAFMIRPRLPKIELMKGSARKPTKSEDN